MPCAVTRPAIGVTVPNVAESALALATYAVTGLPGPAGEPGDPAIRAPSAAACGAGTTKPSPTANEISTAGMTRQRSTARRALIVPADIAYDLVRDR
jgi:hypothetical protein